MLYKLFTAVTKDDKNEMIKSLIQTSSPRPEFFLMVILAIIMATIGLAINNVTVVIASMLIAPLLLPVLTVSLGLAIKDGHLVARSLSSLMKSSLLGAVVAALSALVFADSFSTLSNEIFSRTEPSLTYFVLAFIAGAAVSIALSKPNMSAALPGVAIAVALIPPLSIIGIGLAKFDLEIVLGASWLYLANITGIVIASWIVFFFLHPSHRVAIRAVKKDDKDIEAASK